VIGALPFIVAAFAGTFAASSLWHEFSRIPLAIRRLENDGLILSGYG
jgi:hypothetical protein